MENILIKNLTKYYNKGKDTEIKVLNNINLSINKGDLCSIVGVSGSGKTTLLYILGCLDKQTEGEYYLDGKNISNLSENQLAMLRNKYFGFILQDFGLIEEDTVYENICVPLLFSKKILNIESKINDLLKKLEILNLKDKKVKKLFGGQRQRVAIARALINNPDVILADEPTGSLDTRNSEIILNLLLDLNKQGKTVIIVTHNLEIAEKANKKFFIKDGIIKEYIKWGGIHMFAF